jgi:hypothetical protein
MARLQSAAFSPFLDDRLKFGFNSGYAAMFFYVISGFLITFALTSLVKSESK